MNLGIGLGITNYQGVPTVPLDPDAVIAALFGSGEEGAWYDPSDLSTVWQDAAGTTPATAGDPVGRIDDKSGNGNHATQSTSTARPTLQTSGGLYYLDFDGVDDQLIATGYPWAFGDTFDLFFAINANSSNTLQCVGLGEVGNVATYNIVAQDGSASTTLWGGDHVSVSYRVNGFDPSFTDRNSVFDLVVIDSEVVVGCIDNQLQYGAIDPALIHGYSQANLGLRGRTYGWIIRDVMTTAEREAVESYLATKSGVTLP